MSPKVPSPWSHTRSSALPTWHLGGVDAYGGAASGEHAAGQADAAERGPGALGTELLPRAIPVSSVINVTAKQFLKKKLWK